MKIRSKSQALVFWVTVSIAVAEPAVLLQAQDSDPRAAARESFGDGVVKFQAGDYDGALEAFRRAYSIRPHPTVRVNIANCYEQLGEYVEALSHFRAFLREATDAPPEQTAEVEAAVRRLERRVAWLDVSVRPAPTALSIDGEQVALGDVAEGLTLLPGRHTIEARAEGYRAASTEVRLRAGQRDRVVLALVASAAETPAALMAPPRESSVAPGSAPLAGEPTSASRTGRDDGSWLGARPAVVVIGSVGVGLLVASATSGILALDFDADFDAAVSDSNDPALSESDREAARTAGFDAASSAQGWALACDVFLVGSLIAVGTAVYLHLSDDDGERLASVHAAATVSDVALGARPIAGRGVELRLEARF